LESTLRIAIMGSGGVGGYFGARLVKGGADVHFVARGAHLAAMREHGLAVEGGPEPLHLPKVNVTDDPRTIGPVDIVMFCVKLWDSENAVRQLLPIVKPGTGVVSFQNGVQKDDMLRPILGDEALMGGVAYVGTHIGRPGVIAQTGSLQRLVFGEYHGRRSARLETFYEACKRGGINAEISDDVRRRPRAWSRAARGLRRTAHGVLRRLASRNDDVDAPRSAAGQATRVAVALRRRGRPRCRGRRADADEPRRARRARPSCAGQRGARAGTGRPPRVIDRDEGQGRRPSLRTRALRSRPR
jgi:hypothetical protein